MNVLHHFSEDGGIEKFIPHVPQTNPSQAPAVWAIDAAHAPLYWFPRDCPRATAWPRTEEERLVFEEVFATSASRLHVVEFEWLQRIQDVTLYRYDFDPEPFEPWQEAAGQWISKELVRPVAVREVGDLLALHRDAGIELRLTATLHSFVELVVDDRWEFSTVRLSNATRT